MFLDDIAAKFDSKSNIPMRIYTILKDESKWIKKSFAEGGSKCLLAHVKSLTKNEAKRTVVCESIAESIRRLYPERGNSVFNNFVIMKFNDHHYTMIHDVRNVLLLAAEILDGKLKNV